MKRKNQLIDQKVLVEGNEKELAKNEVLVARDSNDKVILKELVDGTLTTISAGNGGVFDNIINSCVTFKAVTNNDDEASSITFTEMTDKWACISRETTYSGISVWSASMIKGDSGANVTVPLAAGETIYIAFQDIITSGQVPQGSDITQRNSTITEFKNSLSCFFEEL